MDFALEPGATQLPIRIQGATGPGWKTRDGFLESFLIAGYSVVYRVCAVAVVSAGLHVGGYWLRKKIRSVLHVHQAQPCTPATMKRVADSQLTKDTEDGDDGPEVNGLWSMLCYPEFTSPCSRRRSASASRRPQTPNSRTGGVHAPSPQSPIPN
jgi:hypothetical protein